MARFFSSSSPRSPSSPISSSPSSTSARNSSSSWKRIMEFCYSQLMILIGVSVVFSMYHATMMRNNSSSGNIGSVGSYINLPALIDRPGGTSSGGGNIIHQQYRFQAQQESRKMKEEALAKLKQEAESQAKEQLRHYNIVPPQQQQQEESDPVINDGNKNQSDNEGDEDEIIDNEEHNQNQDTSSSSTSLLVNPKDWIYTNAPGEAAPVVIEEYKLIFFNVPKVGCTVWKMLFRR